MRLVRGDPDEVEHRVVHVGEEDVARLVLGRGHPLDGVAVEDLPDELRLGDLEEERVLEPGVDLVGVAEPHLLLAQTRAQGERLVDELAGEDGVRLLDRVGRRQVVVLAGVDDDAGARDEPPRDVLVDEGAAHVDVAKEDAVHRVVEQHVEPLDGRHPRDLRHAEARRVVRLQDVAPAVLARLVEGAPDDLEVLLRRERAAVALGRRAVRHVVEQRLRRRADDRDDVGSGARGGLRLHGVVVDVAGRDDDVLERLGPRRQSLPKGQARFSGAVDARESGLRVRAERLARLVRPGTALEPVDLGREREPLGGLQGVGGAGEQRPPEQERDPAPEEPRLAVSLDGRVDERRALVVDPFRAVRPEDGPLDAHGRVRVDVALHVVRDVAGKRAALRDLARVHGNGGHHPRA